MSPFPKGKFTSSEMLETGIFVALLGPESSRDGSRSGVPACREQDGSFLQPEQIAIRNNPPEKPERKLQETAARALVSPPESRHVTAALSHRSAAGSSPRGRSAFGERGFTGQPAVTERG